MKKLSVFLAVVVAVLAMAVPANAGFRIGPRVGVAVSDLHFNDDLFKKENRTGFTGGLQAEVTLPLGICFDASVMYVRRSIEAVDEKDNSLTVNASRDYIDVPINFKWKLGLPIVGKIISPYLLTGPDFAFLTSKRAISEAWKNHKVDVAWNFGVGVELFKHLQVGASYGLGMTKIGHAVGLTESSRPNVEAKTNCWTITAAWMF